MCFYFQKMSSNHTVLATIIKLWHQEQGDWRERAISVSGKHTTRLLARMVVRSIKPGGRDTGMDNVDCICGE